MLDSTASTVWGNTLLWPFLWSVQTLKDPCISSFPSSLRFPCGHQHTDSQRSFSLLFLLNFSVINLMMFPFGFSCNVKLSSKKRQLNLLSQFERGEGQQNIAFNTGYLCLFLNSYQQFNLNQAVVIVNMKMKVPFARILNFQNQMQNHEPTVEIKCLCYTLEQTGLTTDMYLFEQVD